MHSTTGSCLGSLLLLTLAFRVIVRGTQAGAGAGFSGHLPFRMWSGYNPDDEIRTCLLR
jgi:hypothetical protein